MNSYVVPTIKTRDQLLALVEDQLRDTANNKFSATEIYKAINRSLLSWHNRGVSVPQVHTITGGWVSGTREYTLPDYITLPIQPQRKQLVPYIGGDGSISGDYIWTDITGWTVEPDGSGNQVLRLEFDEGALGDDTEARLLWWAPVGRVITTASEPELDTSIDADDTTVLGTLLSPDADPPRTGYIKIGNEYIFYGNYESSGGAGNHTACARGVGSTAAAHSAGAVIYYCVAFPNQSLLEHLLCQTLAHLYGLGLAGSSDTERDRYEWNMRYWQQQADQFWYGWMPRSPQMKLSRRSIGA